MYIYAYVYIYTCIYMYVYICTCIHIHMHICVCIYMHMYTHTHAYICMYIYANIYIYTHAHIPLYKYLTSCFCPSQYQFRAHICRRILSHTASTCSCKHTYIHTHTHTYIGRECWGAVIWRKLNILWLPSQRAVLQGRGTKQLSCHCVAVCCSVVWGGYD